MDDKTRTELEAAAFRRLVAGVTWDLVPLRDPFDDDDRRRCRWIGC